MWDWGIYFGFLDLCGILEFLDLFGIFQFLGVINGILEFQ